MQSTDLLDAVVCGSCVLDILCKPVTLDAPVTVGTLHRIDPPSPCPGGITTNAGIAMARLGLRVGVASLIGNDPWGEMMRDQLIAQGVNTDALEVLDDAPTSTTVVLVDSSGERSFLHAQGAPKRLSPEHFEHWSGLLARSRWMLLGYYPLLPLLMDDLPGVFKRIRQTGCKTALDATAGGGSMCPLDRVLPHLDLYVPSLVEAQNQTGEDDPKKMIDAYRECGSPGIVGIKLGGADGVLLSPQKNEYVHIPSCAPPGEVVDTTGAGDCFLAGLIAGLVREMNLLDAGRIGCAAGAMNVTAMGGWPGVGDWQTTRRLAQAGYI